MAATRLSTRLNLGVHDAPIHVSAMARSGCPRWPDLGVHDGPKSAVVAIGHDGVEIRSRNDRPADCGSQLCPHTRRRLQSLGCNAALPERFKNAVVLVVKESDLLQVWKVGCIVCRADVEGVIFTVPEAEELLVDFAAPLAEVSHVRRELVVDGQPFEVLRHFGNHLVPLVLDIDLSQCVALQGIDQRVMVSPSKPGSHVGGTIVAMPVLGGPHHEYRRVA